jgi:hypothetical protein
MKTLKNLAFLFLSAIALIICSCGQSHKKYSNEFETQKDTSGVAGGSKKNHSNPFAGKIATVTGIQTSIVLQIKGDTADTADIFLNKSRKYIIDSLKRKVHGRGSNIGPMFIEFTAILKDGNGKFVTISAYRPFGPINEGGVDYSLIGLEDRLRIEKFDSVVGK